MRPVRFGTQPSPGDITWEFLGMIVMVIVVAAMVYLGFNIVTFAMLMFGPSGMELDPFFHAPLVFLLGS
jgi:hypothetical protein